MALAAPKLPNPLEGPAVVLIDEIELHLHPGLQRVILPRLQKVFPQAQFIVTTHSPRGALVTARGKRPPPGALRAPEAGPRDPAARHQPHPGMAFGDPGRPPEVATKLKLLRDAVDADHYDDGAAAHP